MKSKKNSDENGALELAILIGAAVILFALISIQAGQIRESQILSNKSLVITKKIEQQNLDTTRLNTLEAGETETFPKNLRVRKLLIGVMSEAKQILVCDDDADTITVVRTILTNRGYTVIDASNGEEALEKLKSFTPDLIVLDIMMPGMSGYDVVIHLKQKPATQNIPIIMLTAKSEPEDLLKGYTEFSVDYYIPKPFTTRQLLAGIDLILGDGDVEE